MVVIPCVACPIALNVFVAFMAISTKSFGSQVLEPNRWYLSDNNIVTICNIVATVLNIMTMTLATQATSRIWNRRVRSDVGEGAGLAELQTLGIFQSFMTLYTSVMHLLRNRYIGARDLYIFLAFGAIFQHLYTTALVSLINPTLTSVRLPPRSYRFQSLPFMEQPGFGDRCRTLSNSVYREACLQIMLSGNTLIDVNNYNGRSLRGEIYDGSLWAGVNITFTTKGFIAGRLPLGPLNNEDLSDGSALFGLNIGTIERLISFGTDEGAIWDSIHSAVTVKTAVPILTSQCTSLPYAGNTGTRIVHIHCRDYYLLVPVPDLDEGEVTGQVTQDATTLLLSFGDNATSSNIHCAVNLKLTMMNIKLVSDASNELFFATIPDDPWKLGDINKLESPQGDFTPLKNFAKIWLGGLGWSESPTRSSLATFLGRLPIGSDLDPPAYPSDNKFLEYYTLVMLASGISAAFPPETDSNQASTKSSLREFHAQKQEFYIGITTKRQYAFLIILALNAIYLIYFAVEIVSHGWFPDWTDPAWIVQSMNGQISEIPWKLPNSTYREVYKIKDEMGCKLEVHSTSSATGGGILGWINKLWNSSSSFISTFFRSRNQ